jgi:hypothetical protein
MQETDIRNEGQKVRRGIAAVSVAVALVAIVALLSTPVFAGTISGSNTNRSTTGYISIQVKDLSTGKNIPNNSNVPDGTPFQVTVTTNNVNCAGQFVVTALGAPTAPPSVLVQILPYIVGPFGGSNSASGSPLAAGGSGNIFKVSTTCDGAARSQFATAHFQFFVT